MIRKYRSSDFERLTEIIRKNWNYREYNRSEENCILFSEYDLLNVLVESNFSSVIEVDDRIVGFLFASIPESNIREDFSYLKEKLVTTGKKLSSDDEGKLFEAYSNLYERVNKQLLKSLSGEKGAEITLFAIDPDERRKGYGRTLLENFTKVLEKHGRKRKFLFTDSTCDYKFYEHNGFIRVTEIDRPAALRDGEIIEFYLYISNEDNKLS